MTRYGTLLERVGFSVIAERCSENNHWSKSMIRHSDRTSESWKNLPWKRFRKDLSRLQRRLFKAVQVGDKRKARSLQKLILRSKAARMLAIRQVSQLNAGKKTAGVDGKASLNFEERFALEENLKSNSHNWHHNRLRVIPIPKNDGSTRILKVEGLFAIDPSRLLTSV